MAAPQKIGSIVVLCIAAIGVIVAMTRFVLGSGPPIDRSKLSPAERGRLSMSDLGCRSCHSKRAPVLEGALGRTEKLNGGTSITIDEAYLRESILDPGAKIVSGYGFGMPSYRDKLSEQDLVDLIAAMK